MPKFSALALAALVAALTLCAAGCTLFDPGASDEEYRGEMLLETLRAERAHIDETAAGVAAQLEAIRAAPETSPELETLAANLEANVAEARSTLTKFDDAIAGAQSRLADLSKIDDPATRTAAELAAAAEGVAPFVPSPFGEILGLIGVLGGGYVAARQRSKRRLAEIDAAAQREDKALAVEAVRDLTKGFDTWYQTEITNGGKEQAIAARASIQGRLSDRTRPVVAGTAEHPLGAVA